MSCSLLLLVSFTGFSTVGNSAKPDIAKDSAKTLIEKALDTTIFDTYLHQSHKNRFTEWVCNIVTKEKKEIIEGDNPTIDYYRMFEGKTIAGIRIKSLDVFGPTFTDTTRLPLTQIESFANKVHFQTRLKILRKNILFQVNDKIDPFILAENEQFIRSLPYIKDVSFLIEKDTINPDQVFITVLTKDVYSFGASGKLNSITAGYLSLYNNNVFGVGHQLSVKFLGSLEINPPVGFETFYTINNMLGSLVDLKIGYTDTYKQRGILFDLDREFQYSITTWAGGITFDRYYRNKKLASGEPVLSDEALEYRYMDGWAGINFPVSRKRYQQGTQLTLTARASNTFFFDRPEPNTNSEQFYANNTLWLAGITHSTRNFQRSNLIYAYGITEDIPSGFLYEMVGGYYNGEYSKRYYTHLVFSKGLVSARQDYFYSSFKVGGYWNQKTFEQGQIEINGNYITRLFNAPWGFRFRQFAKLNYIRGIKRFDVETLYMNFRSSQYGIRGLTNEEAQGKQRLSLRTESVFFQKPTLFGFNIAWYGFTDLGWIGKNNKSILSQRFFSGIGAGMRFRNESLIFNTIQLQFAFYPRYGVGMGVEGVDRNSFDRFKPGKPTPLSFR